jgi:hypothetical protein
MDYGGNPMGTDGAPCGYAPVVTVYADNMDWIPPTWFRDSVQYDPTMVSPFECQVRCLAESECDFFSYQWALTGEVMFHECYLKTGYTEERCTANPYVPWSEEDGASDAQWHGQSGPGISCTPSASAPVPGQRGDSGVVPTTPGLGYPQSSTGHAAEEEEEEELVTLGFLALIVIIACLAGLCSRKVEKKEADSESMYSNGGGYGDASSYSSGTSGTAYGGAF